MRRSLLAALVVAALPTLASAQVNTERLRQTLTTEGPFLRIDGSVGWMRGNVDYLEVGTNIATGFNRGKHHLLAHMAASYAEFGGEAYLGRAFAHLRWTAEWHERLASEVFLQDQYDRILFLKVRAVAGAGGRVTLFDSDAFTAYAATGYMIEREVFQQSVIPEDEPHPRITTNHRWTNYLTFTVKADDLLSFTNTIYVQPRFDDFSDYRVAEEVAMTLSHETGLSLSLGLRLRFDSRPPTALQRLDVALETTLGFYLQKKPKKPAEEASPAAEDEDED
ncbi:MAG: DUF481 domain-containing protein [Deltaproteobacteria bacterium]|nr:DUF481 domain-containing protein [Deltaproteobacteria bacterium]